MKEKSIGTLNRDGRNIDPALGELRGEASVQRARPLESRPEQIATREDSARDSYHGLPLLKETVWKTSIPLYLYVGGLSGACAALGAAAQLRQGPGAAGFEALISRTRLIAAGGAIVSAVLLIEDLGRPSRFFNMLRVFRKSSPMSVGSWVLSAFGAAASGAAAGELLGGPKVLRAAAGLGAGLLGLPLAGYTGVLLAGTAVPVWQGGRTALPPLFLASAAASAASALDLCDLPVRSQRVVRRFGVLGKVAELAGSAALERELAPVPRVANTLREGLPGTLWRAARVLTALSLVLSLPPRRPRVLRIASGLLGTAGALAVRFAIFHAGQAAARDPHAAFDQQRAGSGDPSGDQPS